MTDYKDGATTPLYDDLLAAFRTVAVGKGAISQAELAKRAGRTINQNFRRAIKNLQREGIIKPFRWTTPNGGYSIGYETIMELEQMPLPGCEKYPF